MNPLLTSIVACSLCSREDSGDCLYEELGRKENQASFLEPGRQGPGGFHGVAVLYNSMLFVAVVAFP